MQLVHYKFFAAVVAFTVIQLGVPAGIRGEDELDWDPEKTWVFAVGILEWEHSEIYASFPAATKDRRDAQLVEYFQDAGVPEEQITYLQDAAATKKRILHEFRAQLRSE